MAAWVLALAGAGCADLADRSELPSAQQLQVYTGVWEYRYGDSPRRADGSFAWADAQHNDGQWRVTTELCNPPGRGKHQYLWLRTRLVVPELPNATLLLPKDVYQSLEGYLDGRRIAGFGPLEGAAAQHFIAKRPIYLPLGDDYGEKMLVLRFQSPTWHIGFIGLPLFGGQAELLVEVVKQGLPFVIVGVLCIVLGIGILVFYTIDRSKSLFLLYGLVSLAIGLYQLAASPMRAFLFEEPLVWRYVYIVSLCLMPAAMAAFLTRLLAGGLFPFVRWMSWSSVAYLAVGTVLALSGTVHPENLLWLLRYLFATIVVLMTLNLILVAWHGNTDARILAFGFFLTGTLAVFSTLQAVNVIHQGGDNRYAVACLLMLTMGVLLARRFRDFNKRLADYSTVLQLSFSSAQDLTPGHQAQIALAELLRMLQAQHGLLFLCESDGSALELVAGRDSDGKVLLDPATEGVHDQKIVAAVLQKRRPFVRKFSHAISSETDQEERLNAVAAPLLARGQLLGVIYLEAESARHTFDRQDVEILLGLGSQVALTLMATRAVKLESEGVMARQRLAEQGALLEVAARLARGDLESPIAVAQSSEMAPLAQALDNMRLDLRAKIDLLESSNAAVQQLNEELRFQIEQRLRRLMDLAQHKAVLAPEHESKRTSAAGLSPGDLLGEHYQILALLGEGMSGSVYEVERTTDKRHLAAKVISSRADKPASLRFIREAQILARLSHPNVVSIVDVDITADAILFIVMELVRGTPLNRWEQRYGELDFALAVLQQIAAGLRTVHERGIVHRDLKPANVLVACADSQPGGTPQVKLVDFGVSSLSARPALDGRPAALSGLGDESGSYVAQSTAAGVLLGSPMYLAPELAQGSHNAGPPSDVFSFGVIAYELLSAEMPFDEPPVVTCWRGQMLNIPSLKSKCPKLPLSMLQLVERCLAAEPAQRPTTEQILTVLAERLS